MSVDLSQLHGVLKDKTRSKVLELLGQRGTLSYSELQEALEIRNTGKLNYHLKVLGDLLIKNEATGRYALSEKGKVALELLGKFQVATRRRPDGVLIGSTLMVAFGLVNIQRGLPGILPTLGFLLHGTNPPTPLGLAIVPSTPLKSVLFAIQLMEAAIVVPLGLSYVVMGAGAFYSRRWAWLGTIISLALTILVELAFFAAFALDIFAVHPAELIPVALVVPMTFHEQLGDLLTIAYDILPVPVVAGAAIYYATMPRVRAYFGRSVAAAKVPGVQQLSVAKSDQTRMRTHEIPLRRRNQDSRHI